MTRDEIDARRYRWLRDHGDSLGYLDDWLPLNKAEWDAAIDAEMEPRYELTDAGREALGGGK